MKRVVSRTNLLLDLSKVRKLRKTLRLRSNSEAVRRAMDERLAVESGLDALRELCEHGGLEDVFGRVSVKTK